MLPDDIVRFLGTKTGNARSEMNPMAFSCNQVRVSSCSDIRYPEDYGDIEPITTMGFTVS